LQNGEVDVYERDSDGNIRTITVDGEQVPVPTGEKEIGYTTPAEFYSSIAMSGGDAEAQEYGLSIADYNATCICPKNAYPIAEGTLIWHTSEIVFKDAEKTIPEPTSADYTVIKVSDSINFTKYVLKALVN
jgi:hypothetical protein